MIKIQKIEHRSEERIRLDFEQSNAVVQKIKQIDGRKWSQTKKCWHIPYTKAAYQSLVELFGKEQIQTVETNSIPYEQPPLKNKKSPTLITKHQYGKTYQVVVGNEVIVEKWTEKWLKVYVPQDKKGWQTIVKSIDGRQWDGDRCCWLIPHVKNSLIQLKQIDDLYFNFTIDKQIPGRLPPKPKSPPKPKGKDRLNAIQQKAITALEEKLLLERKSWRTIKAYTNLLMGLFLAYPDIKPSQISRQQMEQYLLQKIKVNRIGVNTQNQMINAFKAFYERLLQQQGKVVIQRPKKPKKLPNVFSKKEIEKLLKSVENLKHKAILVLVYSSGLRRSEVLDLQVQDIHFERKSIHIRQSKHNKDRYILLADSAAALLQKYLKAYKPKYWLFEGQAGGRYSECSIQAIYDKAKADAKVNPRVTLHGLRHSYATHLVENGVPLHVVKEMLGHNSLKTTEIYLHISNQYRKQMRSPLDDLNI